MSLRKDLHDKLTTISAHVLDGCCKDWTEYREKVAERKAYLTAMDMLTEEERRANVLDDDEEGKA